MGLNFLLEKWMNWRTNAEFHDEDDVKSRTTPNTELASGGPTKGRKGENSQKPSKNILDEIKIQGLEAASEKGINQDATDAKILNIHRRTAKSSVS